MIPTTRTVHVVVLVHGIMGNREELGYVKEALERDLSAIIPPDKETSFLVHTATSNDYNTLDGIEAGGRRLADEINELMKDLSQQNSDLPTTMSLSLFGNSLGGLYARFALAHIDWRLPHHETAQTSTSIQPSIVPNLFVTFATPHLGIRDMIYWKVPRCLYPIGAWYLQQSGSDLFQYSDVVERLCLNEEFLKPLAKFTKRIAYANAFSTDAAVPTSTAAFLSSRSDVLHTMEGYITNKADKDTSQVSNMFPTVHFRTKCSFGHFQTENMKAITNDKECDIIHSYSKALDALGWTKIFVDVRSQIPSIRKRGHRQKQDWDRVMQRSKYTSAELNDRLTTFDWNTLPFGHSFLVASTKNQMYRWFYSGGRPLVDRIAQELVHELLTQGSCKDPTRNPKASVDAHDYA